MRRKAAPSFCVARLRSMYWISLRERTNWHWISQGGCYNFGAFRGGADGARGRGALLKKPVPFGKYYLLERINVGGMAEVFRAKAYGVEGFERLVAVKRILPNIAEDKEFITMFVDEAKISVQLNHANIGQIFDLGVVDGAYYIALEHVHGRDLRAVFDRCRNQGEPMTIAQACFILMKVCEGLDYAHNKRDQSGAELHLVHRDVSPQNILVSFEGEVKVIDFGIAKAAGKGAKTQAGILKGKFGYMSPEQVRGLPIDRRSDIFACGIVLYELLTGERLFVGESDFSTLEKVRNVEILPPSTYNRKIPDELERIVLKALAKDVEDRYQNAIDLHDELQAFVYTAGEFYSRKDLAGWMKRTFAREIEAESAKLEQFRNIPPPPAATAARLPSPLTPASGRSDAAPAVAKPAAEVHSDDFEWDDDELETQIYDEPGQPAAASYSGQVAVAGSGGGGMSSSTITGEESEPDLRSLVQSSTAWPDSEVSPAPARHSSPPSFASGSKNVPSPFPPEEAAFAAIEELDADDPSPVIRLVNGQSRGSLNDSDFPVPIESLTRAGRPGRLHASWLILGLSAFLVLIITAIGVLLFFERDGQPSATVAGGEADSESAGSGSAATRAQPPRAAVLARAPDMDTGFDIIVEPKGARILLDGKDVGRAPRRIRNIIAGTHVLQVDADGYHPKKQQIAVVQGEAETVRISLDPKGVRGRFMSEPPGAEVTLISDGVSSTLGPTPAGATLDPQREYRVRFKKPGYLSVTKPVKIASDGQVSVAVVLERAVAAPEAAGAVSGGTSPVDGTAPASAPVAAESSAGQASARTDPGWVRREPRSRTTVEAPATLDLGAKPPCKIFIDDQDTGKTTPQRGLELTPGRHKITLVNNDYGINQTIRVSLKPGEVKRIIKDYTEMMQ
jgi:eukaryotic-like serine/threonine-protein kinase